MMSPVLAGVMGASWHNNNGCRRSRKPLRKDDKSRKKEEGIEGLED